jgi:hypothetical protein
MREIVYLPTLASGNLVNLVGNDKDTDDLEFVTSGTRDCGPLMTLWENIDLKTFPSSNDFHGHSLEVPRGTIAIVLGIAGVPAWVLLYLIARKEAATSSHRLIRNDMTVYDILVQGRNFQAFGCDMKLKKTQ